MGMVLGWFMIIEVGVVLEVVIIIIGVGVLLKWFIITIGTNCAFFITLLN